MQIFRPASSSSISVEAFPAIISWNESRSDRERAIFTQWYRSCPLGIHGEAWQKTLPSWFYGFCRSAPSNIAPTLSEC